MPTYHVRPATLDDADALARHRLAMFSEMGTSIDAGSVDRAFRRWLADVMGTGAYQAWVVETDARSIVAGGGMLVLPWPPGPHYLGGRIGFVYNVYTEPAHRRRGLAQGVMTAIHQWCRDHAIGVVGLNASAAGQPMYEAMGYQVAPAPMMLVALDPS